MILGNVWQKGEGGFCRYAEMDKDAKNKISHRRRALDKVRNHFFDSGYAPPTSLWSQLLDLISVNEKSASEGGIGGSVEVEVIVRMPC